MSRPIITNIYKRRSAFSDELLSINAEYPDQQIVIIDELLSKLNHIQLDELEDLIVNNYDTEEDDNIIRYQTLFAKNYGAVAAPTAGLHFTKKLKNILKN